MFCTSEAKIIHPIYSSPSNRSLPRGLSCVHILWYTMYIFFTGGNWLLDAQTQVSNLHFLIFIKAQDWTISCSTSKAWKKNILLPKPYRYSTCSRILYNVIHNSYSLYNRLCLSCINKLNKDKFSVPNRNNRRLWCQIEDTNVTMNNTFDFSVVFDFFLI